jgi:predicted DNA-binding WGR domain protein
MRMNFGPINMAGGEKRLNVAFSRAKHHMAVVSSIHFSDITNDFNEGAACFKNYLRYAEAVSEGRSDAATRVLHGLCRWHGTQEQEAEVPRDATSEQLAAALARNGLLVDRGVGQSHFRCDLAVRRPGEVTYRLGILVDGDAYYEQAEVLERDVMRPKLLQAFGWNVCQVFAKDWHQDRERVLEYVLRRVAGDLDADADEVDAKASSTSEATDYEGAAHEEDGEELSLELESSPSAEHPLADAVEVVTPHDDRALTSVQAVSTTRYFEFRTDTSNKFWEITLSGSRHSVRFGRIGAAGQESLKEFADENLARQDSEALIRQKLAKGYLEVAPPLSAR